MDLTYVVLTWYRKVSGLYNCAVDVLTPVLAHLLLVDNPEKLSYELRIDGDQLDHFVPDGKDLIRYNFYVTGDQRSNLFRLPIARLESALQRNNLTHRLSFVR